MLDQMLSSLRASPVGAESSGDVFSSLRTFSARLGAALAAS